MQIVANHRPLILNTAQPQRARRTSANRAVSHCWPRRAAIVAAPLLGALAHAPMAAAAEQAIHVGPAGSALLAMGGAFAGAILADRFISESPDDIATIPMGAVLGAAGAALLPSLIAHGPASIAALGVGAAFGSLWSAREFAGIITEADARQMVKLAALAGALLGGGAWTLFT